MLLEERQQLFKNLCTVLVHFPRQGVIESGRVSVDRFTICRGDRVVQTATKLVLEPIFEADFEDNAYGYRPARSSLALH